MFSLNKGFYSNGSTYFNNDKQDPFVLSFSLLWTGSHFLMTWAPWSQTVNFLHLPDFRCKFSPWFCYTLLQLNLGFPGVHHVCSLNFDNCLDYRNQFNVVIVHRQFEICLTRKFQGDLLDLVSAVFLKQTKKIGPIADKQNFGQIQ